MKPAESLFASLTARSAELGRKLNREEWLAAADAFFAVHDKERKITAKRARDEIMEVLCALDCPDPRQATRSAWKTVGTAKALIVEVSPVVTPQEIKRRAAAYRKKYPNVTLSANALAKHWGEFPNQGSLQSAVDEPEGWRTRTDEIFPDAIETGAYLSKLSWEGINRELQRKIVARCGELGSVQASKVVRFPYAG